MTTQQKMTIGIDARMYGDRQTGIGNYIAELIKELEKTLSSHHFVIFLKEPYFSNLKFRSRRFHKVKADIHWYGLKEQFFFPGLIAKSKVDLMHYPHFNVPVLNDTPFVVTIHDLTPFSFPGRKAGKRGYRRAAFHEVLSRAVKRARKIITVSGATKRELTNLYPGLEPKIEVVYQGVKNFSEKGAGDILKKYNIKKPFIFYTGVWRDHKNLPALISAFHILKEKYGFEGDLVLGGEEDPAYPENSHAIRLLDINRRVKRVGFIPEEELPHFYKEAELFALPSLSEGFGLVGVEAWQFGLPVVASRISVLKEVLGEGAAYFNPKSPSDMAHKMNLILRDGAVKNILLSKAKEGLKRYNWKKTAQKTLMTYEKATQ